MIHTDVSGTPGTVPAVDDPGGVKKLVNDVSPLTPTVAIPGKATICNF